MIRLRNKACPILLSLLLCTALPPSSFAVQGPAGSDSLSAAASEPRPAWERYPPRPVGTGAKAGLVAGAAAGIGFGVLVSLYADAEDDDGLLLGEQAIITGFFGLAGAAGGGLLGAWLGSLISKDPKDGLPRGTRPLRSVALTGGYADFTDRDDATGGFQGRAALYSHFEPWLAVGAEYGLLTGSPHCWRLAAGVRVDPFPATQTVRPYLAGSIGGNFWQGDETLLSGDVGAGVELPYKRGLSALGLEGRYHFNLQNAVEPGTYTYTSIGLTWRIDS